MWSPEVDGRGKLMLPSSRCSASTREVDGGTHEPQPPNRPTPAVHLGARQSVGRRASAPGSAGAAQRERRAESRRRPRGASTCGGAAGRGGGSRGEGLHPAKFPDGLSLPALSAFPARPARPYGPGRSFTEKNARRAAGPWSRTEPPLGKGRAAAAAEGAIGLRGLRAAPFETLAAAGDPGEGLDWTAGLGCAARRRVGAGGGRGNVGAASAAGGGAGARSPEGRDSGPADRVSSGCRRVGQEGAADRWTRDAGVFRAGRAAGLCRAWGRPGVSPPARAVGTRCRGFAWMRWGATPPHCFPAPAQADGGFRASPGPVPALEPPRLLR
uniref:Uncharacterized protein n=1 Tax=Rangifer tarandus platyrhynchus TaxID=3082113 RepID=A0ACB0DZ60_RANTA|nr:unnamed protein product [Rangifer tarandus platyrhynchus]